MISVFVVWHRTAWTRTKEWVMAVSYGLCVVRVIKLQYTSASSMSSPQHQLVSSANPAIALTSLPATGGESAQGSQSRFTVNTLPDESLLDMFDWYLFQYQEEADSYEHGVEAWHTLVHVCERWRAIVFESPRRLNLRLFFTNGSSVQRLAVWPPLPIIVWRSYDQPGGLGDIIGALGHNDHVLVCEISLSGIANPQLEEALAAMERPFPALTELGIRWQENEADEIDEAAALVVPASFLGGSAPRLQYLEFDGVPFPGLPRLLSSATNLVHLHLWNIPFLGYFSPEAMVDCLRALTKLELLSLGFESSQSRLYQDIIPSTSLPFLKKLNFKGDSEYLEHLVAPIQAPLLASLKIALFSNSLLDTPRLLEFVSRTPIIPRPFEAEVDFSNESVSVTLASGPRQLHSEILCRPEESQLLNLTQVCRSSYPLDLISRVKHLYIGDTLEPRPDLEDDTEADLWPEVLRSFSAVEELYLSWDTVNRIAETLRESGMEVLPALQHLFLEEPQPLGDVMEAIEQFAANRPIMVHFCSRSPRFPQSTTSPVKFSAMNVTMVE